FMTERRIGDSVRAGEKVGVIGNETVAAPANGVLLGLAARGARIAPGDELVEVDTSGIPYRCHGIGAGPRSIASRVLSVVAARGDSAAVAVEPTVVGGSSASPGAIYESPYAAKVIGTPASPAATDESATGGPVIGREHRA